MKALNLLLMVLCLGSGAEAAMDVHRNIPYAYGNQASQYHRMDIHVPRGARRRPVLVFVHGGSWHSGDKSNVEGVPYFLNFFDQKDYVVVSVNHRLVPHVNYAQQGTDIAAALAYTRRYIGQYGGDPNRIFLMGYSSGAHLVAMVGTDPKYLGWFGMHPSFLKGVMCMDVNAYDIPRAIQTARYFGYPSASWMLPRYFSSNPYLQWDASPVNHVRRGRKYPPFLLVYTRKHAEGIGWNLVHDQAHHFARRLRIARVPVAVRGYWNETHGSLMEDFGAHWDAPTGTVNGFLKTFSPE